MMAGSHLLLGAAAWTVVAPHAGQLPFSPGLLALAAAGALLPDIDHPKSWVGHRTRPVSSGLAAVFGHRGMTHSLLAAGLCAWALLQQGLPQWAAAPFVTGYLSHLAADMMTPAGLRLFWPSRRTWALPVCRTGSGRETAVVCLLLCAALCATPPGRHLLHGALRWSGLAARGT